MTDQFSEHTGPRATAGEQEHQNAEQQADLVEEQDDGQEDLASDRLMTRLREALAGETDRERLHEVGELLFEEFSAPEYPAEVILPSLAKVYRQHRDQFDPQLDFDTFLYSFGPGLIRLCQQKLADEGDYDLGRYGENNDGVDGILGRMTKRALRQYFRNLTGNRSEQSTPPSQRSATQDTTVSPPPEDEKAEPGSEKPRLSPKDRLEGTILDHYHRTDNSYRTVDLPKIFGRDRREIEKHITDTDPVTGGELTFLGRPLFRPDEKGVRGTHLYLIPFLKIAEEKIRNSGVNYEPKAKSIGGYCFRGMKIGGKETKTLSSHAFGLAIDIDPSANGPRDDRGNIPDQVALAMVESGFAWGYIREAADYPEFGIDPMHFQLRFPPDSPEGQAIINSSPTGQEYWRAVQEKISQIDLTA